jgi:hypothetical protein
VGEAEGVGEAVAVAVVDALRSVVVSGPLTSAGEVLSRFSGVVCSVCAGGGGSSGSSDTATVHPTPAEITVAARAHAGAPTTTATTRSHPRLRLRRRSHRTKVNAPRIKVNYHPQPSKADNPSGWMATIPSACTTPTASRSRPGSSLSSGYARSE